MTDTEYNAAEAVRGMYFAVHNADFDRVQALLDKGVSPDILVGYHNGLCLTALGYALSSTTSLSSHDLKRHIDIVDLLLKRGACPDGIQGAYPPLFLAYNREALAVLLRYRPKLDVLNSDGCTALNIMVYAGSRDMVKMMLDSGADPNFRDKSGMTSAFFASSPELVRMLADYGADFNIESDNGCTPLFKILPEGPEVIRAVIEAGADPNHKDSEGRTPLHILTDRGYHLDYRDDASIRALAEGGADVNLPDANGSTPLYSCLSKVWDDRIVHAANVLLEYGADPNVKDKSTGKTPLQTYIERFSLEYPGREDIYRRFPGEVVRLGEKMIEHGGCIDRQDKSWNKIFNNKTDKPLAEYLYALYELVRTTRQILDDDLEGYLR